VTGVGRTRGIGAGIARRLAAGWDVAFAFWISCVGNFRVGFCGYVWLLSSMRTPATTTAALIYIYLRTASSATQMLNVSRVRSPAI
jgi:hypothetical protein